MERKMGLSSLPRFCERFRPPGIPIHRVVRVLEKVRALFAGQAVGMHGRAGAVAHLILARGDSMRLRGVP